MRVLGSAHNITPRSNPAACASDAAAGETGDGDIVEVFVGSVDEGLHGKKASEISFNPQN